MFEDVLYPKEVIAVMTEVLNGSYQGSNPESHIDQLLGDFYLKLEDKKGWVFKIGQAVKSLGCLDCVYARLNLECLLEAHEGDKITIRYNRQRLLPGENHGLGCCCRACAMRIPSQALAQGSPEKPPEKQLSAPPKKELPPRILPELPDPAASYEKRHQGTSALANSEIADKRGLQDALERNRSRYSSQVASPPPSRATMVPAEGSETKILTTEEQKVQAEKINSMESVLAPAKSTTKDEEKADRIARGATGDYTAKGEKGPDGEEVIEYPTDQETLAELEATFYANEVVVHAEPPRPSIDPERKVEILESLRQQGFEAASTREKAWERLEKLLRKKSPEASLIGRLAYLIILEAFKPTGDTNSFIGSKRMLMTIAPRGALPPKFGQ